VTIEDTECQAPDERIVFNELDTLGASHSNPRRGSSRARTASPTEHSSLWDTFRNLQCIDLTSQWDIAELPLPS
jgi:hypothetical protein